MGISFPTGISFPMGNCCRVAAQTNHIQTKDVVQRIEATKTRMQQSITCLTNAHAYIDRANAILAGIPTSANSLKFAFELEFRMRTQVVLNDIESSILVIDKIIDGFMDRQSTPSAVDAEETKTTILDRITHCNAALELDMKILSRVQEVLAKADKIKLRAEYRDMERKDLKDIVSRLDELDHALDELDGGVTKMVNP